MFDYWRANLHFYPEHEGFKAMIMKVISRLGGSPWLYPWLPWLEKLHSQWFYAIPLLHDYYYWLVVYLPLWKMMEFVSWDDEIFPIYIYIWKNKIHVPNHQPGYHYLYAVWSLPWYPHRWMISHGKFPIFSPMTGSPLGFFFHVGNGKLGISNG